MVIGEPHGDEQDNHFLAVLIDWPGVLKNGIRNVMGGFNQAYDYRWLGWFLFVWKREVGYPVVLRCVWAKGPQLMTF